MRAGGEGTLRQSPLLVARPVSTTTSGGRSRRRPAPHERRERRRGEEGVRRPRIPGYRPETTITGPG